MTPGITADQIAERQRAGDRGEHLVQLIVEWLRKHEREHEQEAEASPHSGEEGPMTETTWQVHGPVATKKEQDR